MSKYPLYNQTGLQKNNKSYIMYSLANKHIELKQIQNEYEAKISKIKIDLTALETTICLFDRDCSKTIEKLNVKSSKSTARNRNKYFAKDECRKLILTALRTTIEPLIRSEVSLKVQDLRDIDKSDNYINKNIQKIVVEILRTLEKGNIIEQVGKDGLIIESIKQLCKP